MKKILSAGGILASVMIWGCAMPRQVMLSPVVTPPGGFTAGYETGIHVSAVTVDALDDGAISAMADYLKKDSADIEDDLLRQTGRMAVAQGVDPLGAANTLYLAYGLAENVEIGYQYLLSGHGLWARYQAWPGNGADLAGTVGFYASMQSYDLPSFMGKVQDALGYEFARKDFTIPFSLGRQAKGRLVSGEWAAVAQVQMSQVKYAFEPTTLYTVVNEADARVLEWVPEQSSWFWSVGGGLNGRLGIGPVYLGCGAGYYWQDYGDFKLLGETQEKLSGGTFVAHAALELRFWD